jgi:hypothetical protein
MQTAPQRWRDINLQADAGGAIIGAPPGFLPAHLRHAAKNPPKMHNSCG